VLIMHCQFGYGGRYRIIALTTMFHEYHALLYFPAFRATECMMLVAMGCSSVIPDHIRQDHFIAACNTAHFHALRLQSFLYAVAFRDRAEQRGGLNC
jgi:hypothetical protein